VWEPVTDMPPEPLHVFSRLDDRYLTLAFLAAVLTLGTVFFAVVVGVWYLWVAGSILAALLVLFIVRYRRARAERRAARAHVNVDVA